MGSSSRASQPAEPAGAAEHAFGSTMWEWRRVKINRAPQASTTTRRRRGRWHYLPRWNPREPLSMKVRYRGGSEAWIEITARGDVGRYPGHTAIIDVMNDVWQVNKPH